MKVQVQKGSKNTQKSSDPNTVQIQIGGLGVVIFIGVILAVLGLVIYLINS